MTEKRCCECGEPMKELGTALDAGYTAPSGVIIRYGCEICRHTVHADGKTVRFYANRSDGALEARLRSTTK